MEQNKDFKLNALTGKDLNLYNRLKLSINNAEEIDIIVSFIMESGVKLLIDDLKLAIDRGVKIRILTGNYLNITQPQALYLLRGELEDKVDLHFYNVPNTSFHPKAYIFHNKNDSEIYIGSSNLSKGALTNSIEWNYHFKKSEQKQDFIHFYNTFEELFNNYSIEITDDVLKEYSKTWIKPKFLKTIQKIKETSETFEPREAQIEALYALDKSREEGFDKALIVAATGIGKTYLAAFDCKNYNRVLFVAHREEIIYQASESFKNIYPEKSRGYFYRDVKNTDEDFIFALVQSLGKEKYLDEKYFKRDDFDYIIIDEFHHAVASNYKRLLNYFKPKFLLGLTATPERLDNKDVFALCDYNNVYELRLKEAIGKGWLVPFKYYGIYDGTVDYSTITMKNGHYDDKKLEEKLMINRRGELVYKNYLKYPSKRCLGFCSSRSHAEYMAKFFNEKGIKSAAIYSGSQRENAISRNEGIEKLKKGDLKILFTVDMFNEGVDLPSIDMILFLRPTQSPTIFLQQLGRGLRRDTNKEYLTVLDFIGNYKKANLIPLLLSETKYDNKFFIRHSPLELEYPEDCFIDFDFQLIDLFKEQAKNELNLKDKIITEYYSIKSELGYRPSRMDLFLKMDENIIETMKKRSKFNIFKDYLGFLNDNDELLEEEKTFINTIAHDFLKVLENTSMTKSYKMPILKAFYNNGEIKLNITEEDVYTNMKEFYNYQSNGIDMLKDKSSKNYKNWNKKEYLRLAKNNPIKFLKKSSGKFFIENENYALGLNKDLEKYITLNTFKKHFNDIIEYRTMDYYKNRLNKQLEKLNPQNNKKIKN